MRNTRFAIIVWGLAVLPACFAPPARAGEGRSAEKPAGASGKGDAASGDGEERQTPPEQIALLRWRCKRDGEAGVWKGALRVRNTGERPIDILAVRIELDGRSGRRLGRTKWIRLGELPPEKAAETAFRVEAPADIGVLWARFRYFYAPEGSEDAEAVGRKDLRETLYREIDTSLLDALDEAFFTLDPAEKPARYSEAALAAAVEAVNRAASAEGEEGVTTGRLQFLGLEEETGPDGAPRLRLALNNTFQPFKAGQLRLQVQFKDGAGEVVHTLEHTVPTAVPLGPRVIRLPDPGVEFLAWEIAFAY